MTLIWRIMRALCAGEGAEQQWLAVIDYLVAENRVLQQQLAATGRRARLTDGQRRELAVLGRKLKPALRPYISIVKPETVMAWYRRLVTAEYDSSKMATRKPGRPSTADELRELVCLIARENPSWGYTRIRDQLRHLGHDIGRTTIVDILMTDAFDGPLLGAKYLLYDRDSKFTASFDHIIASAGIKPIKLPARSPNLNAYAERWVLSVKSEALDHLILVGERQVRRVVGEYLAHYHGERAHQGLNGDLIQPHESARAATGEVVRRKRLGGLLSYYHRPAA